MKVAEVKITEWDKNKIFSVNGIKLKLDDYVVVKNETTLEIGKVLKIDEIEENEEISPIIRKANSLDFEKIPDFRFRAKALSFCREMIKKRSLPMKLVDAHFSLDGSKITFAFIADGRVDFRELIKDLTSHFNATIRLHQIGIRDEAKIKGDCGHCGQILCCKRFLKDFNSISSNMAEGQQVAHRGSERISGLCGRLMCCLGFEQENYEELAKKLPSIGQKVRVGKKKGVVVGHYVLKQAVDVEFPAQNGESASITEVSLNRKKDKEKE